jgi:CheY-like chemotaxis protein
LDVSSILKTILLAEDSEDDEKLFLRILRQAGVENHVSVVRDGDEVIAYLKGDGVFADRRKYPLPCALFLDLRMRRVDGWEVLRWIRTQEELAGMLVVVLTIFDAPKAIMEAYRLGAHSFLIKPFAERDVKNLVQYFRRALTSTSRNAIVLTSIAKLLTTFEK